MNMSSELLRITVGYMFIDKSSWGLIEIMSCPSINRGVNFEVFFLSLC